MATSSKKIKLSDARVGSILKNVPKLQATRNDDLKVFNQTKVKIQDHFKNIQKSAKKLESKLLNELDKYAEMHRNMLLETNSVIEQMTPMLNTLTDAQIKENLYNNIDLLNKQKYINIDVNVEEKLLDYMNKSISINIEMASDTNLNKVLSSNTQPVMHYSKQKAMISLETLHTHFNEIKTLLAVPKYLEQGNIWYLIGRNWVEQWLDYEKYVKPVDGLIPIPPPIDNSDIMDDGRSCKLKYHCKYNTIHAHEDNECITEELVMGRDFAIFNEAAWGKLVEWYGIKEGTVIFPRSILPRDRKGCVDIQNISLCLYPRSPIAKFKLFPINSYFQFNNPTKEIRFFDHDTEPEKLTAVKRVLEIPLSSEIIIFREENSGTRIHPITNKKYTVISSIVPFSYLSFSDHPIYLVAVKSIETEWLYV